MLPKLFFCFLTGISAILLVLPVSLAEDDEYVPYGGERYDMFDWDLMKTLRSPQYGNVFISPLSVKMVLAMLYEGATGPTEKELHKVLQLPISRPATRDRFQVIINSLRAASNTSSLDIGSRIFLHKSIAPEQRFEMILKMFYDADIKPVDFSNKPATTEEINRWASDITHDHIKELVNKNSLKDAVIVLANALYYRGLWSRPFPPNVTNEGTFYVTPTKPVTVKYMTNYAPYYYGKSSDINAEILRLPFQNSNLSMFIVLPNERISLSNFIQNVNPTFLTNLRWAMNKKDMFITIPKFSFEYKSELKSILQELGVRDIFEKIASLPGFIRKNDDLKNVYVSDVIQKAGIIVNEEGSTAWAATDISVVNKFGKRDPVFNASRPFMFCIEDEYTGSILFIGKVENPAETM